MAETDVKMAETKINGTESTTDMENVSPRKKRALEDVTNETENANDNKVERRPSDVSQPVTKKMRFAERRLTAPAEVTFTAPVPWVGDAYAEGKALYVDDHKVIIGTRYGKVVELSHSGDVRRTFLLPTDVECLMNDGDSLYAWCPAPNGFLKYKGSLFDVTTVPPRHILDIQGFGQLVRYAAMYDGLLALGDDKGSLAVYGCDGKQLWKREQKEGHGHMFCVDSTGIYFAHKRKVVKYRLETGEELWNYPPSGNHVTIQYGIQHGKHIYVETSGKIVQLDKEDGSLVREFIPSRMLASGIGVGNNILITGSCPTVIFELSSGKELYRMNFSSRMEDAQIIIHSSGKVFALWDKIYCIDLSEGSILRAVEGKSSRTRAFDISDLDLIEISHDVELVTDRGRGKIVEVMKDEEGIVKVKPFSEGFDKSWDVQIPFPFRVAGKRFVVDGLRASQRGKFYWAYGAIKELTFELPPDTATEESQDEKIDEAEKCEEELEAGQRKEGKEAEKQTQDGKRGSDKNDFQEKVMEEKDTEDNKYSPKRKLE